MSSPQRSADSRRLAFAVAKVMTPYYEAEKMSHGYAHFEEKDHVLLRDILKEIKGKCIVSYNDTDFIRELYKDFSMESIEKNSNLTAHFGRSRKYAELIIKNF